MATLNDVGLLCGSFWLGINFALPGRGTITVFTPSPPQRPFSEERVGAWEEHVNR